MSNLCPFSISRTPCGVSRGRKYRFAKRCLDVAVCVFALPFVVPVMVLCAAAIRIESRGPILFAQRRTGYMGKRFRMFKFRTMVENAEALKQELAHLNQLTWPDFKLAEDPRVTRVGRFLRKTSLDELPQIINVLIGDMTLVGPRPTSFAASTYALWHTERLEVQPGLTGLWQISGRSDLDFDDRVRLDQEYIARQSLWFDFQILVGTILAVIKREGAY